MSLHTEYNRRESARDEQVLDLLRRGWSYSQIANRFFVSRQRIGQIVLRLKKEGKVSE
jgi:DNA-binding NarL/FixJ family response regulator